MRYVITGGLGFLGVNLARYLLDLDDEAQILIVDPEASRLDVLADFVGSDRITVDSWSPHVAEARRALPSADIRPVGRVGYSLSPGRVEVRLCRVRDLHERPGDHPFGTWSPDRVYHLASYASPVAYRRDPIETLHTSAIDTMVAIALAGARGARLLFTSTSEVYGDPEVSPQPESYRGNVSPIGPRSQYDEGKRYGEALIAAEVACRGLDARIARIFNTYGPGMDYADGRLLPALLAACEAGDPLPVHRPGTQTRSLCYVDDTIRGLVALMESGHPNLIVPDPETGRKQVEPVNIGGSAELPVLDIATRVAREWSRATGGLAPLIQMLPNPCHDDPRRRRADTRRALAWLDWRPEVCLETGIRLTVADRLRRSRTRDPA